MNNDRQKARCGTAIKVAFSIIEAAETLNAGRSGWDEFVHGVVEKVLMGTAIPPSAACGM
jgi:hypothetical protein